jgi:hypothetical protein
MRFGISLEAGLTILQERSPTKLESQVKAREAHMGTAQSEAKTESPPKKQKIDEMKTEVRDSDS